MTEIAVIGAGLAGLTAARVLQSHATVTVFEKSRGAGGRMATRRAAEHQFDHGAQFFKARTPEFQAFLTPLLEAGVIRQWGARFVEISEGVVVSQRTWDASFPHYVGVPGMHTIGKTLCEGLAVRFSTRVARLRKHGHRWTVFDDLERACGDYDWVITAIPSQQALDLLPAAVAFHSRLMAVRMMGCFSLMLGFDKPVDPGFDAALVHGDDISWISANHSKPGRANSTSFLVHSTNAWADRHLDDDRDEVMAYLCERTAAVLDIDTGAAVHQAVHGWRYANIARQSGQPCLIDDTLRLAACGDWCLHGRVEAAFISGFELAHRLIRQL